MADNSTAIAAIDAKLRAGVSSFANDGTRIVHDMTALRAERLRLIRTDDALLAQRPSAFQADLGGY